MKGNGITTDSGASSRVERDSLCHLSPEHRCPYLPGRSARHEAYYVQGLDGALYERMLAQGFRRSGRIVYRPRCRDCTECRQVRVPVDRFVPSKSMKRVSRINSDVQVGVSTPSHSDEKFEMYCRYLEAQHDQSMERSRESFREFLYESPMATLEFSYFMNDRLAAVSILDQVPEGLSSVYMYFDPDFARRSLGVFSIIHEIEYCRTHALPYYYLGFYIAECPKMAYKARYRPNEVLAAPGHWVSLHS